MLGLLTWRSPIQLSIQPYRLHRYRNDEELMARIRRSEAETRDEMPTTAAPRPAISPAWWDQLLG